jgi:hypothetical protein
VITLSELAAWEGRLAREVARATGSADERDRQLARAGVYAEYGAVFSSYVALVSEDPDGLEALKRAAFLAWFAVAQPSVLSGIGDLPESAVRRVFEELDRRCRVGPVDEELRFMVPWYYGAADFAFTRFPGLRGIEAVAGEAEEESPDALPHSAEQFNGRGLMGEYWGALVRGG